jgi:hypothetical protein
MTLTRNECKLLKGILQQGLAKVADGDLQDIITGLIEKIDRELQAKGS